MEQGFQYRLEYLLNDHLGDPVRHGRNTERTYTTVSFGNVHTPYRLRHITAGSHSVPQFVEIVCNILVKPGQCLPVNACRPTVGFYSFISFPYLSFTYRKWLCRFYSSPPIGIVARGCRRTISTMGQALCSGPITVLHRYYGLLRPCTIFQRSPEAFHRSVVVTVTFTRH
ncbi:Uncharacterised protein [Shigella sonnei]|nr:Uncharacterised protein [Shigella sonnei]SJD28333.1 Uncharacterised protein [Shigella sonnei]